MIELLTAMHNRSDFDCGKELLNTYIRLKAGQDMKRKLAACFVFVEKDTNKVRGFYTLSNNSISLDSFSEQIRKKLPKSYLSIPTTLIGRLAVDKSFQGEGLGKILLIDALKRSFELLREVGSFAVIVDPIDKNAERFYDRYDFIKLPDSKKMFISMKTLSELFQ